MLSVIDAAILLPEGWYLKVRRNGDKMWRVSVYTDKDRHVTTGEAACCYDATGAAISNIVSVGDKLVD